MSDARGLHCPNCGAPAAPEQGACGYCRATLATVSCPSCFNLMFDGAIYCPSCGARRARTTGGARQAPCPACKGAMREVVIGETALLECERCHGTWVDVKTFEHICASRESQAAVLHQWPGQPAVRASEVRYRTCVACGTIMNRLNFGRLSGTIVDVCRGHGTFLDAGELHNIVAFIQAGGLDRARQRQIEDLKEEQQRLEAKMTRPHEHSLGGDVKVSWNLGDVRILLDHLSRK